MSTSTELVAVEPLLPMSPEQATEAMTRYQAVTAAMLKPEDWQTIPSGKFVKRSGWTKIASSYGISVEILSETVDRDAGGVPLRAHTVARAHHPNGRYADGSGACSIDESRFKTASGRGKAEHDVGATATTRAFNRAISNLVGFGQVSAEEMDGDGTTPALPYGPEGDANADAQAAAIVTELFPAISGAEFVAFVNRQFGTEHLPQASARMVAALKWAVSTERGNIRDEEVS